jgi:hypothetical protein
MILLQPSPRPREVKTACTMVMLIIVLLFPLGVENSIYNPREDVRNIEGQDVREARHLFWRGVEHFNAARFGESVNEFRAAARRSSHYEASSLFNVALVFEKSGMHETGDIERAYMVFAFIPLQFPHRCPAAPRLSLLHTPGKKSSRVCPCVCVCVCVCVCFSVPFFTLVLHLKSTIAIRPARRRLLGLKEQREQYLLPHLLDSA